jgi:hypothetical protein
MGFVINEAVPCVDRSQEIAIGCRDQENYPMVLGMYGCYRDDSTGVRVMTWGQYYELPEQGWSLCDGPDDTFEPSDFCP